MIPRDLLKKTLNKMPVVKRSAKVLLRGVIARREKRQIAAYHTWLLRHDPSASELTQQKAVSKKLSYRPLISIIAPTYNTPEKFFREMVESVLVQTYDNWELVLVDDASPDERVRELIREYAANESRIRPLFLSRNHHIAGATNEGIKQASGDFISLFDHDDILRPNALFEIANALNANRNLDFIYTDEDKVTGNRNTRIEPFFKPDWNPDFLHSVNYITHFTTIRRSVLDAAGYEDGAYNGAQDWELYLRITRGVAVDKIHHIPKVLYSWRIHNGSTAQSFSAKPYVVEAQRASIKADLQAAGGMSAKVQQDIVYPGQWQLTFIPTRQPMVSIIVSDARTVSYIRKHTGYKPYEIIVVEENDGALSRTQGDYLVIIEGKHPRIARPDWVEVMLGDAEREDIGFVVAGVASDAPYYIRQLVAKEAALFAVALDGSSLTKHLYTTTRYNVPMIANEGVAMVELRKLRTVLGEANSLPRLGDASRRLARAGYRNLYNPYVK